MRSYALVSIVCAGVLQAAAVLPAAAAPSARPEVTPEMEAARAAFERKDWPALRVATERATVAQPSNADAWNLLGFAHRKMGDYKAALIAYDEALSLDPSHRGALEYLGEAYVELGRREDALKLLGRLELVCGKAGCEELDDLRAALAR